MYKLHSFWYTFGNPFFTAIVICVAVGIPCLILYLCTIFAIVTYKKRQRLNSAHNVVNIEAIRDVKNISDIKNHNDNDNDKAMANGLSFSPQEQGGLTKNFTYAAFLSFKI